MGTDCSKYNNNHFVLVCVLLELSGIFIYIISNLEFGDSCNRNFILIYFYFQTTYLPFFERMQRDDGWTIFCLDLDVSCNPFCFSYIHSEQYLSQNRNIRSGNKDPSQRACNISELHVVPESPPSLFQVHCTIQREAHVREVRNRTVTECCAGFVQLYSECIPKCSDCVNIQCNSTSNQCTCLPGFIGNRCNETCDDGKWGDQCKEVCICRIGEDCDKATGLCTSSPTKDLSTSAPKTQSSKTDTTVLPTSTVHIHTSEYSLVTFKPTIKTTEQVTTSSSASSPISYTALRTTPTSHVTLLSTSSPTIATHVTSTDINNLTAATTMISSTYVTKSSATLPPTFPTAISSKSIENNSAITLTTANSRTRTNITATTLSDIRNTVQSVVTSDFTTNSVLGKVKLNNISSSLSVYNITLSNKPQVTKPVPIELPSNETKEPSEITSTNKPQITNAPKEIISTTPNIILFTPGIPLENYSKNLNVSLESSREFSLNTTMMYAQWINDLGANSSVTLAAVLVLLVLVIVTTSVVIRCYSHKKSEISKSKQIQEPTIFSKNSHYDIPGPPTFSFINAYALELLTKDIREANYDHPCSARCLVVNEPVYDELKY